MQILRSDIITTVSLVDVICDVCGRSCSKDRAVLFYHSETFEDCDICPTCKVKVVEVINKLALENGCPGVRVETTCPPNR